MKLKLTNSALILILCALILPAISFSAEKKMIDEAVIKKNLPAMLGANNVGKDFWFTIPPCFADEAGGYDNFIKVYVTTAVKTPVNLEIPCKGKFTTKMSIPNDVILFDLLPGDCQPFEKRGPQAEVVEQIFVGQGVHVYSDYPMVVYAIVRYKYTSDGFLAIPTSSLGKEYICASYNTDPMFSAVWGYHLPSMCGITSPYNDNKVKFVVGGNPASMTAGDKKPGQSISIVMNKGDVFMVSAKGDYGDLAGSKIIATKPISVVSGNQCNNIPAGNQWCDYCCEMELPAFTWGKDYHVPSVPGRKWPSLMRVFAKEPLTTIYRDGKQISFIKNYGGIMGEGYQETRITPMDQAQRPVVISGDKPIYVMVYNCGVQEDGYPLPNSDPFWMVMTPMAQYQKEITFCTPATRGGMGFEENYLNLVYQTDESSMMPNDMMFANVEGGQFNWVPMNQKFPGVDKQYNYDLDGKHFAMRTLTLPREGVFKIKSNMPFAAYSFGYDWCDSYGYPTSAALADLERPDTVPPDPKWTLRCDGSLLNGPGTVTDMPNDDSVRSNLSMITFQKDESFNYDFTYKDFVPGETRTTTWDINVIDITKDARAVITFTDRRGNDTTVVINYYAVKLSIDPDNYDFGRIKLGEEATHDFKVINESETGLVYVTRLELASGGTQHFEIINNPIPFMLGPKESKPFTVKFKAEVEGENFMDSIRVGDTCVIFPKSFIKAKVGQPVILVGDEPNLKVDADFGYVKVDESVRKPVHIRNLGSAELNITSVTALHHPEFRVAFKSKFPIKIPPTGDVTFEVDFTPSAELTFLDSLVFSSDANTIDSVAPLKGIGIQASLIANSYNWGRKRITRPAFPIAPYEINQGDDPVITLRNKGTAELTVYDKKIIDTTKAYAFLFDRNKFQDVKIPANGELFVQATFQPQDTGKHYLRMVYNNEVDSPTETVLEGTGIVPLIKTYDYDFGTTVIKDVNNKQTKMISIDNSPLSLWSYGDDVTISDLIIGPSGTAISTDGTNYGTEGFIFDKTALGLPKVLKPGEKLEFPAYFVAQRINDHDATVTTVSDALIEVTSKWHGNGLSEGLSFNGGSLKLCIGTSDSIIVHVKNTGTGKIDVTDISFDQPVQDAIIVNTKQFTLPGKSNVVYDIVIRFTPGSVMSKQVKLVLQNSSIDNPKVTADLSFEAVSYERNTTSTVNKQTVNIGEQFYYDVSIEAIPDMELAKVDELAMKVTYKDDFFSLDDKTPISLGSTDLSLSGAPIVTDNLNRAKDVSFVIKKNNGFFTKDAIKLMTMRFNAYLPYETISKTITTQSQIAITSSVAPLGGSQCLTIKPSADTVSLGKTCVYELRKIFVYSSNYTLQDVNPNPIGTDGADVNFSVGLDNSPTSIQVVNTAGAVIATPIKSSLASGTYSFRLPIENMASGVYLVNMQSGLEFNKTIRFTVKK
ncbi:MAG: IgGFc binding protein [Ignavibacteria bacterium]|nr:IgGFc binding protein [Ignavibacteria bacterium]